ncbi:MULTISPECIES: hypothetical protein [unclassified Frankia]|nr:MULTISPECIES: hypothetical protein [unclassified Frankia]
MTTPPHHPTPANSPADRPRDAIPELMRGLPVDLRRDLPIPASTALYPDGTPDFSTVDGRAAFRLATTGRCGICGNPFDREVAFLGGPGAVQARAYHDPPMHESCGEASTRLCPALARHHRRRPTDRRSTGAIPADSSADLPEVWVMWICRGFAVAVPDGYPVFRPQPPIRLRTYAYTPDGRLAETTRPPTRP